MVSLVRQILGFTLAFIGFLGIIIACVLPMWKVTANFATAQVMWEGLWMNCVTQSKGHVKCKIYDPPLALLPDLQAARAPLVTAIIICVMGVLLGIAGSKCTNFVEDAASKAKMANDAGVVFTIAGVLVSIPLCWSAMTIIWDSRDPFLSIAKRRELGVAFYIGWGASTLLILGGKLFCSSCPPKDDHHDNCPPKDDHHDNCPPKDDHQDTCPPKDDPQDTCPPKDDHQDTCPPKDKHKDTCPPKNKHKDNRSRKIKKIIKK